MNKKILIGSILAVAVLIGVSFTSVVGYSSVKPDVKASPLFTVRTNRAIDEDSEDLTCDYVGKGEEINLVIPKRDDKSESVETLINLIKEMDDRTLRRLAFLITYQTDDTQELDYEEIFLSLKELRDTPDSIIQNILKRKGQMMMSNICSVYSQYLRIN